MKCMNCHQALPVAPVNLVLNNWLRLVRFIWHWAQFIKRIPPKCSKNIRPMIYNFLLLRTIQTPYIFRFTKWISLLLSFVYNLRTPNEGRVRIHLQLLLDETGQLFKCFFVYNLCSASYWIYMIWFSSVQSDVC